MQNVFDRFDLLDVNWWTVGLEFEQVAQHGWWSLVHEFGVALVIRPFAGLRSMA